MERDNILSKISRASDGLVYISETEAPIKIFLCEQESNETIEKTLLRHTQTTDVQIEAISFDSFFERLTTDKDRHNAKEKERVKKFCALRQTLMDNLSELKVFKIGRVRKEIFVVGRDKDDRLVGVRTESVET